MEGTARSLTVKGHCEITDSDEYTRDWLASSRIDLWVVRTIDEDAEGAVTGSNERGELQQGLNKPFNLLLYVSFAVADAKAIRSHSELSVDVITQGHIGSYISGVVDTTRIDGIRRSPSILS